MKGYVAICLHTHLPYVRHADDPNALEQRWLFEAITESYIPLLNVFHRLREDGVAFRFAMSVTPPLMEMLRDPLLQARYISHLDNLIHLAEKEVVRLGSEPRFRTVAEMYLWKLREARHIFCERYQGDLLRGFLQLEKAGCLDLITSAGTHAYLPLLRSEEAVRSQVRLGVRAFQRHFGHRPRGIWLPECGYRPGLDEILAEENLEYFLVDSHAIMHADPAPPNGVYAPVRTAAGLLAFGRDKESAKQVWSSKEGYPGDYDYREYYRDVGFDLDWDYIREHVHPDGIRVNTGLKYYRITGDGHHKEPYNPAWAQERAAAHASHFLHTRLEQAERLYEQTGEPPVIVSPYDTELFGHWWYEGPAFLDYLCRKMHYDQQDLELIAPLDCPSCDQAPVVDLPESSWGNRGYSEVWLNEANCWIYPHLHAAEERMAALAEGRPNATGSEERALNQACRELMLAQSSDWPFIISAQTTVEYANRRLNEHLRWFFLLCEQIESERIDEAQLRYAEQVHSIFPYIDYRDFCDTKLPQLALMFPSGALRVLMLSWEYPPLCAGGLGRHVHELSRNLAKQGVEVHVCTLGTDKLPRREVAEGVVVHRVPGLDMPGDSFADSVFQANLRLYELARRLWLSRRFDLVHGHDWLVGEASRMIARRYGVPLLATIHATEYGRNQGIHNSIQRAIDRQERMLMSDADQVIVCSRAMHNELNKVFGVPEDKLQIIPNGVDVSSLVSSLSSTASFLPPHGHVVAFLGRFVREKGVQLLMKAAEAILSRRSDVYFVLAGNGPLFDDLQAMAVDFGIADRVIFPGFVNDKGRNALLGRASVAVFPSLYEPFGIVALEAMGAGVPTIVSDTGGFAEIVEHEVDGLKVYPGDLHGLVNAIERLLDDRGLADALVVRAREKTLRKYTWHAVCCQTLDAYRGLKRARTVEKLGVVAGNSVG
ncbi:MAG: 1,4-alpha-glucan branching protein domain-containing protein [Limnochordia bacterium]|jgi:1,4-alpha-glucan branching enzyme